MPTSRPHALTHICSKIIDLNPKRVLDVGIGHGKFGFLTREYTDVWRGTYYSQPNKFITETIIDGIEVHETYIGKMQREIYDDIHIGNALTILPKLRKYDLIICCAVLEHFNKADGHTLLTLIKQKCEHALITVPVSFVPQKAVYGNSYEIHLAHWECFELSKYGQVHTLGRMRLLEI